MTTFLDRVWPAMPPWGAKVKVTTVAVAAAIVAACAWRAPAGLKSWQALVDRRDAIAGSLLSVNASLLGFSITSFAVLLSVRKDEKFAALEKLEKASEQMWGALISASWATATGALTALLVVVIKGPRLADWFQTLLTAALFITTAYVVLSFAGVIAVIQSLVWILGPKKSSNRPKRIDAPVASAFQTLGPPRDDD